MEDKHKNIIIFVLIIALVLLWNNYSEFKKESLSNLNSCKSDLSSADDTIDEANDNIDQANSNIEDAQGYAWSDYDDMGYALDNLETVDNVSR